MPHERLQPTTTPRCGQSRVRLALQFFSCSWLELSSSRGVNLQCDGVSHVAGVLCSQWRNRMIALEARGLMKAYTSVPAVSDVSFSLNSGEVLGCLGPNGSGKSSTVRMLIGLSEPTRGEVLFCGKSIQLDLVGYRKLLGYVPEEANLYPFLSGSEYLELVGTLRGMAAPILAKRIEAMLELFSLHPHRHSAIGSYSKGMRQRILLIAALIHDPGLLVLDEP